MVGKKMTKTLSKLCTCLFLAGAVSTFAVGCGSPSENKDGDCEAGQQKAVVNGTEGCFDQCDSGMCAEGFMCQQGLCLAESGGNNNTTNNTNNNTTGNNTTGNNNNPPNNTTGNNNPPNNTNNTGNTPTPEQQQKCEDAADLLWGMCFDGCTLDTETQSAVDMNYDSFLNGDGTAQNPSCAQFAADNPDFDAQLDMFLAEATCDTLKPDRCGTYGLAEECNCAAPVNLGAACADDEGCDGGDIDGACLTEADAEFPGGYCAAAPCPAPDVRSGYTYESPSCGDGVCRVFDPDPNTPNDQFALCFAGCDNCDRAGYACQIGSLVQNPDDMSIEAVRYCGIACAANSDCAADDSSRCNTGTGSCEFECDGAAGPNGEPSLAEICADAGGTCTADANLGKEYCVLP